MKQAIIEILHLLTISLLALSEKWHQPLTNSTFGVMAALVNPDLIMSFNRFVLILIF